MILCRFRQLWMGAGAALQPLIFPSSCLLSMNSQFFSSPLMDYCPSTWPFKLHCGEHEPFPATSHGSRTKIKNNYSPFFPYLSHFSIIPESTISSLSNSIFNPFLKGKTNSSADLSAFDPETGNIFFMEFTQGRNKPEIPMLGCWFLFSF